MAETRRIVIDAGHGGDEPGAVYQGRREKDDTLRLALAVGEILDRNIIKSKSELFRIKNRQKD